MIKKSNAILLMMNGNNLIVWRLPGTFTSCIVTEKWFCELEMQEINTTDIKINTIVLSFNAEMKTFIIKK